MSKIDLDKPLREQLARELAGYLKDELGVEAGGMEAVLLLDFLIERIGPAVYNQALQDAQAVLQSRAEQIAEAIDALGKPLPRRR